ncbi:hypothetical protein FDK21_07675 [Cohaesibacter sp. CAU 1516]|uniref:hypothetical protein n=1 Tax=Cohaesibacter sp. CAU 1516 TaxID=2576038 RepID=UPI0010FD785D|nr:hypothetical protein [Cohaesibacter sp. CAU 1516]TLP46890.1 hypothetical protein FDK21_07675 [Cohaesibacter sp. CAU 1516]
MSIRSAFLLSAVSLFLTVQALNVGVSASFAQTAKAANDEKAVPLPPVDPNSYDPQLSAKEAALTTWALAVSGIRAGHVVSDHILRAGKKDTPFSRLAPQARFALKTMITRYSAANWLFATDRSVAPIDPSVVLAVAKAAAQTCENKGEACETKRAALLAAFLNASQAFDATANAVERAAISQQAKPERQLMAEIFTAMADYLGSAAWHSNLTLTELGKDGDEIAGRIVGTLAVWNTLAPYIGMMDKPLDNRIEATIDQLLTGVKSHIRGKAVLTADSKDLIAVQISANRLATEFNQAAGLFKD